MLAVTGFDIETGSVMLAVMLALNPVGKFAIEAVTGFDIETGSVIDAVISVKNPVGKFVIPTEPVTIRSPLKLAVMSVGKLSTLTVPVIGSVIDAVTLTSNPVGNAKLSTLTVPVTGSVIDAVISERNPVGQLLIDAVSEVIGSIFVNRVPVTQTGSANVLVTGITPAKLAVSIVGKLEISRPPENVAVTNDGTFSVDEYSRFPVTHTGEPAEDVTCRGIDAVMLISDDPPVDPVTQIGAAIEDVTTSGPSKLAVISVGKLEMDAVRILAGSNQTD